VATGTLADLYLADHEPATATPSEADVRRDERARVAAYMAAWAEQEERGAGRTSPAPVDPETRALSYAVARAVRILARVVASGEYVDEVTL
jgi:hypothetical protein